MRCIQLGATGIANNKPKREASERQPTVTAKKDPITSLPSDLYTRDKIIGRIVERLRRELRLTTLRIVDVGGQGARMRDFLSPSDEVLVTDLRGPVSDLGKEGCVVADITRAPFASGRFDVVIATDTLEHIESKNRRKALEEIFRICCGYVVIGGPFHSPEVLQAESIVNDFHVSLQGREHPWLIEHIRNGLPSEKALTAYLRSNKMAFARITTNNIMNWLMINLFYLGALSNDVPKGDINSLFEFYNSYYEELGDAIEPTYRKIYVISRKFDIPRKLVPESRLNPARFEELLKRTFSSMSSASPVDPQSAITRLVNLYKSRRDLQKAYPEAGRGDIRTLISWAADTALRRHFDADFGHLRPYAPWYVQSAYEQHTETLRNELSSKSEELTERTAELNTLKQHTETLRNELDSLKNRVDRISSERDALSSKLRFTQAELEDIRRSFGYKLMRFYASRIDRLLPDHTRRGELRRILVKSYRIANAQGIRAFLKQAWWKAKPEPVTDERSVILESDRNAQILLQCDYPRLPADEPIRVPRWFSVEGWAVSKSGIGQVRVYLDDVDLGNATYGIRRPDVAKAFPEYIASESSGFRKAICVDNLTQGLRTLRIAARSHDNSSAAIQAVLEFPQNDTSEFTTAKLSENRPESLSARVSVVIPTKSLPDDFEQTLQQIKDQRITDIEILVMNSGSTDLTFLERRYGAKVYPVDPSHFDHGRTRNYGAELATGEYVCFMTDDAIPANNVLLSDMLRVMEKDKDVAAVTARQIPRSDADLTACEAIWSYYRALQLSEDRVVGSHDLDSLTPDEKRRICQIDNVCSCFERRLFLEYRFRSGLAYAEDLELGIRLVRDGHKIGQLFSNGVIHSHNRPPSYYLRRAYVEAKTLPELLGSDSRELATDGVQSLDGVLDLILDLHDLVCFAVDEIKRTDLSDKTVPEVFERIRKNLTLGKRVSANAAGASEDLSGCLTRVVSIAHHSRGRHQDFNPIIEAYATSLENLEKWLLGSHHSLLGMAEQLAESLHKLMAVQAGTFLGRYSARSRLLENRVEEGLAQLDKFLSMGV